MQAIGFFVLYGILLAGVAVQYPKGRVMPVIATQQFTALACEHAVTHIACTINDPAVRYVHRTTDPDGSAYVAISYRNTPATIVSTSTAGGVWRLVIDPIEDGAHIEFEVPQGVSLTVK